MERDIQSEVGARVGTSVARWLDRAEEARVMAEGMSRPEARLQMLKIAETYKRMAEQAYRRARRR